MGFEPTLAIKYGFMTSALSFAPLKQLSIEVQSSLYELAGARFFNYICVFLLCRCSSVNGFSIIRLLIGSTFDCHISFYCQPLPSITSEICLFYLVKWVNYPTLKIRQIFLEGIAT